MRYPEEVLEELYLAIEGDQLSFNWLMENNFKELGAFKMAISGGLDAMEWLQKHQYLELYFLIKGFGKDAEALEYLIANKHQVEAAMIGSVYQEASCDRWLLFQNKRVLVDLCELIRIKMNVKN